MNTNRKMTPSTLCKLGGLTVAQVARHNKLSRNAMYEIFKADRLRFEELLMSAMKQELTDDLYARRLRYENESNEVKEECEK